MEKKTKDVMWSERTVAEIVTENHLTAETFEKYGIDFCCGGNKTLKQACKERGINIEEIEKELKQVHQKTEEPKDLNQYDKWELDFLADYIINQFHSYTKDTIYRLRDIIDKVANVHGERHPETLKIRQIWHELSGELIKHMQKEELLLFPYIRQLVRAKREGTKPKPPVFGSINNPVKVMEAEHKHTGDCLGEISTLSNGFNPPEDACPTYRTVYERLKEFDRITKMHIHLENNILFPRAMRLEEELGNT